MIYNINFNEEHKDFLKNSYIGISLFDYLNNQIEYSDNNKKIYFIETTTSALLENIIKNDLPLQSISKINHQWLINEQNSENVMNTFYKIYFPKEQDNEQFGKEIIEAKELVELVVKNINDWIFKQEYDIAEYLKKEFKNKFYKTNLKNGI